ncbi:recombinase family protein [Brachybacterium alimentarium]|uniref:recombinase family protein n=1 Tax=Brachybacterium alimentarium TaxID=47845 RepID=UPI003FCFA843
MGSPPLIPPSCLRGSTACTARASSLRKIAEVLTDDGVTTTKGGRWHASSVRSVLNSERMTALAAA